MHLPPPPVHRLNGFLAEGEVAALLTRARGPIDWAPGRQGTGYTKAALPHDDGALAPLFARAREAMERWTGRPIPPDRWDAWLLRYPDGTSIAPHVDPADPGLEHVRLNALLRAPVLGGELSVDGAPVALTLGEAVVFMPDRQRHEVSAVVGERLVFSVGALVARR